MKPLAALVLPAILVAGFFYVGVRVVGDVRQSQVRAEGLVWGKRTFPNRAALGRWLRARGMSYEAWARRHPVPTRARQASPLRPSRSEVLIGAAALSALAIAFLVRRRRRIEWALSDGRRAVVGAGHGLAVSSVRARSAATFAMRRHPDLAWCLVGGALVAAAAVVVAQWA